MHPFPFWNYARALFELTDEPGFGTVDKSLAYVEKLIQEQGELREMINNPKISCENKIELVDKIIDKKIDPITQNLFYVIVGKRKIDYFYKIAERFRQLVNEKKNELCAMAESAEQLSAEEVNRIKQILEKIYPGKNILVETKVKPEFIGGMKISLGDMRYDYSVSGYLHKLKNEIN